MVHIPSSLNHINFFHSLLELSSFMAVLHQLRPRRKTDSFSVGGGGVFGDLANEILLIGTLLGSCSVA